MANKAISKRDNVAAFLVKLDGKTDRVATKKKFDDALDTYIAVVEGNDDLIISCREKLFDELKGASLNREAIITFVWKLMCKENSTLNSASVFPKVSKRIAEIIKLGVDNGEYKVQHGQNASAGTYRVCDRASEETETKV